MDKKIISIINQKSGAGKTRTLINTADFRKKKGKKNYFKHKSKRSSR